MTTPSAASHQKSLSLPTSTDPSPDVDFATTIDDVDFAKTLAAAAAKSKAAATPDLLTSTISHYASKWLPELSASASASSPKSSTAAWLQKRHFVEHLVSILPPERDSIPCDFLLRLLRTASMVGADPSFLSDLESRAAWQLDRASLKEVLIPAFSHTCGTLLDVKLVLRLARGFVGSDEATRSGVAMARVAKLVDSFLAEAALDAGLAVAEFEEVARALPGHARAADDGLYRAIDTFLKAHPSTTKQEKKALCGLIDTRKLSPEASFHAVHNERLPIRSVIQILFSEQSRLNRFGDPCSASFSGPRSPRLTVDPSARCPSKREVLTQQQEMRKLRDDVARLQAHCRGLQAQIDRLNFEKRKKGFFRWSSILFRSADAIDKVVDDYEVGLERQTPRTPMDAKKVRPVQGRVATPKWRRNSLS